MANFKITQELKADVLEFLNSYGGYKKALDVLNNQEKSELSEDEINSVIVLLGTFRLGEVYQLVERFRTEVIEVQDDSTNPQS